MPDRPPSLKIELLPGKGPLMARSEHGIVWQLSARARQEVQTLKKQLGDSYRAQVEALRELLQHYFLSSQGCRNKSTSISPIGGSPDGAKRFKVRWLSPNKSGKSGGLRLAISAYCERQLVLVHAIFARKENPGDADFERAFRE